MQKFTPFLMFTGRAEEAMNLYTSLFENSKILSITRYGPKEAGAEGTVVHATFTLNGQKYMCIDSSVHHDFDFTPSFSIHVQFASEVEIDRVYAGLSQGGNVHMPLGPYPFSRKYAWLSDKFGVSWQLDLAASD